MDTPFNSGGKIRTFNKNMYKLSKCFRLIQLIVYFQLSQPTYQTRLFKTPLIRMSTHSWIKSVFFLFHLYDACSTPSTRKLISP